MEERDLYTVNRDTLTSVGEGGKRHSNLDLCFCSEDLFIKHNQLEDMWGSDHYPIEFIIKVSRRIYKIVTNRISTKRTDWRLYEKIIKSKEHILLEDFKKAEERKKYERIVEVIKEATSIATYGDKYKKDSYQVKEEKRKEVYENKRK